MGVGLHRYEVSVDFNDASEIVGANFVAMQGSLNTTIRVKFTNGGYPLTADTYDFDIYLVTTDSLDFRNSVRLIKSYRSPYTTDGLWITDVPEMFQTKGHCQLIFYVDGNCTLPLDYYVVDNPSYNMQ